MVASPVIDTRNAGLVGMLNPGYFIYQQIQEEIYDKIRIRGLRGSKLWLLTQFLPIQQYNHRRITGYPNFRPHLISM